MKKLLIVLLLPFLIFSQNKKTRTLPNGRNVFYPAFKIDKKEYYYEFIRLLDSARNEIYKPITFKYKTKYDSLASLSCNHHNVYMSNMVTDKYEFQNQYCLTHSEKKNIQYGVEWKYKGKDTLIELFTDRARYFTNGEFRSYGECCLAGFFPDEITNVKNSKELAALNFDSFYRSKSHWEVLKKSSYVEIAIDIHLDENEYIYWVTVNVGNNKSTNTSFLMGDYNIGKR